MAAALVVELAAAVLWASVFQFATPLALGSHIP
jgi:hypothetical protein